VTDRSMKVSVNRSLSNWVEVLSGVPQGSVLGPLLFLVFANDLPAWTVNSIKMFVDDTKTRRVISKSKDCDLLQQDLTKLANWSDKWLLRFHPEKCKVMHVGHTHPTQYYMYIIFAQGQLWKLQTITIINCFIVLLVTHTSDSAFQ